MDYLFQSTLPRGERRDLDKLTYLQEYVSIHAPARGATKNDEEGTDESNVSIHAPARGATFSRLAMRFSMTAFQSTLPRGERPFSPQHCHSIAYEFQSTLPRGERRMVMYGTQYRGSFNPRSRAGSDNGEAELETAVVFVSIHAPARGATHLLQPVGRVFGVSIHAPARGATLARGEGALRCASFNPRSRAGSDDTVSGPTARKSGFNPRSRAGSDSRRNSTVLRFSRFNPRSRAGSDPGLADVDLFALVFQSTLPRGERPSLLKSFGMLSLFQSTLPRGERLSPAPCGLPIRSVSIHAPARGATTVVVLVPSGFVFQSTLPRGERQPGPRQRR